MPRNLSLGIDIGTTKVAAVIAEPQRGAVVESVSLDHSAAVVNEQVYGSFEQSVDTIFAAVKHSLSTEHRCAKSCRSDWNYRPHAWCRIV